MSVRLEKKQPKDTLPLTPPNDGNLAGNAPFSIRLPAELRAHLNEMSDRRMVSKAAYVCALIEADMGKRTRRPSRQHVLLRKELALIHAGIIALGNQVTSGQVDYRGQAKIITDGLNEVVTAILRLEDEIRK
jgi:hypothetical protein